MQKSVFMTWMDHFNRTRLSVRKKQNYDFWLLDDFAKKQTDGEVAGQVEV